MAQSLCQRCRDFDIQVFQRSNFDLRGYSLASVISSAETGCSFCSFLLINLNATDDENDLVFSDEPFGSRRNMRWPYQHGSISFFNIIGSMWAWTSPPWIHFNVRRAKLIAGEDETSKGLHIEAIGAFISTSRYLLWRSDRSTISRTWIHVAADDGTAAHESRDIIGRLFADKSTLSKSNFQAIRKWHLECCSTHQRCNKTLSRCHSIDVELACLPTRCIEVISVCGNARCTKHDLLFFLRRTQGEKGKYIALSHRWTTETFDTRTTKDNYETRCKQGFNCSTPNSITRLMYEAGQAAFALGLKYIWIDSICIVQDDEADWRREAAKMAEYYQYSWLTVVAAYTQDRGLFHDVTSNDITRVTRLPYRDMNGKQNGYFYLQAADSKALQRDFMKSVSDGELNRRGWIYQERLLSRRLLFFSKSGMFVQCQTGPARSFLGDIFNPTKADSQGDWVKDYSTTTSSILAQWEEVVQTYASLELTQLEQDRLMALSGIAIEFGRSLRHMRRAKASSSDADAMKVEYYSGTWLLAIRGLLWEQTQPGNRGRIRGIPTWSWASMAALVTNSERQNVWSGLAIQWGHHRDGKAVCELTAVLPVPVTKNLRPNFGRALRFRPPENVYDGDKRFAILGLRGLCTPAFIHRNFPTEDDTSTAARLTGHDSGQSSNMWRQVTLTRESLVTAGWASIEHPDIQTDEDCEAAINLHGLVLERIDRIRGGSFVGFRERRLTAYTVLYIRPTKVYGLEDCFERIGIGRIFGEYLDEQFREAERKSIWLV